MESSIKSPPKIESAELHNFTFVTPVNEPKNVTFTEISAAPFVSAVSLKRPTGLLFILETAPGALYHEPSINVILACGTELTSFEYPLSLP